MGRFPLPSFFSCFCLLFNDSRTLLNFTSSRRDTLYDFLLRWQMTDPSMPHGVLTSYSLPFLLRTDRKSLARYCRIKSFNKFTRPLVLDLCCITIFMIQYEICHISTRHIIKFLPSTGMGCGSINLCPVLILGCGSVNFCPVLVLGCGCSIPGTTLPAVPAAGPLLLHAWELLRFLASDWLRNGSWVWYSVPGGSTTVSLRLAI